MEEFLQTCASGLLGFAQCLVGTGVDPHAQWLHARRNQLLYSTFREACHDKKVEVAQLLLALDINLLYRNDASPYLIRYRIRY